MLLEMAKHQQTLHVLYLLKKKISSWFTISSISYSGGHSQQFKTSPEILSGQFFTTFPKPDFPKPQPPFPKPDSVTQVWSHDGL